MSNRGLACLTAYTDDVSGDEDDTSAKRQHQNVKIKDDSIKMQSEEQEGQTSTSNKRKRSEQEDKERRLPVPSVLSTMFESSSQFKGAEDDPSAHGGKVRSFAHVRGNWASFAYIPFAKNETLHRVLNMLQKSIQELDGQGQGVNVNTDLHLSLTKTQVFRHHWIDPFIQSLKLKLKSYKQFEIAFNGFQVYLNEDKTRTFLGLEIFPSEDLLKLIEDCDDCLNDYDLELYYEDPSFHVSVAWMVGNQEDWMRTHLVPSMTEKWSTLSDKEPDMKYSSIGSISFKTGNMNFELLL